MSYLDDELLIPITRRQLGMLCEFTQIMRWLLYEDDPKKQMELFETITKENLCFKMYRVDHLNMVMEALFAVRSTSDLMSPQELATSKNQPEFKRKCRYCGKYVCLTKENGRWVSFEYDNGKVSNKYHKCSEYATTMGRKKPMDVPANSLHFEDESD